MARVVDYSKLTIPHYSQSFQNPLISSYHPLYSLILLLRIPNHTFQTL